ncbi:hypothetical protein FGO68_gene5951 [Halteria grandinella]|uniref:Uncharacterized protein n=1 Tax=Halteria grandinella TaxID=5974 RepID=A0A8J8NGJ9_HALGN|nr:hypothetical protein FGO68_gene5951 [Halteria grandinella]
MSLSQAKWYLCLFPFQLQWSIRPFNYLYTSSHACISHYFRADPTRTFQVPALSLPEMDQAICHPPVHRYFHLSYVPRNKATCATCVEACTIEESINNLCYNR